MAISAANPASPTPPADSAAVNGAALLASNGNGAQGGPFLDSLEAVLGAQGDAPGKSENAGAGLQTAMLAAGNTPAGDNGLQTALLAAGNTATGDNGLQTALLAQNNSAQHKSKLKTDTASAGALPAAALVAQQSPVLQQATVAALENTTSGIDIPALRGAMVKAGTVAARAQTMPVTNPLQGIANGGAAANAAITQAPAAPAGSQQANALNIAAGPAGGARDNAVSGSSKAGTRASQARLAAALAKAAHAPVLKGNNADGSKVPNTKIGQHAQQQLKTGTSADQLAKMATTIAATAGATNIPETAPAAAQAVAVAEVTAKTASSAASPSITVIEAAAMKNSAQAALHVAAPQSRTDAQALPVQFDGLTGKSDGGRADMQPDMRGKDQGGSRGSPNANASRSLTQSMDGTQQPQPVQQTASFTLSPASDGSAAASLATSGNGAGATQPSLSHVAVGLQVAPQALQQMVTPDQATFAALGVAIAAKSRDGEHQFDIKMDPAELGKVDVRISVDASGNAQAHLSAQHQHTLELLQNDKATLERNLRDAGLNLANNGLNFSLKGEQQPSTPTFNARSRALSISAVHNADSISSASSTSIAPGDSRLDIRV